MTTDLSIQSRTVGDVKASQDEGNNVRVWVGTTSIRSADGTVRSRSTERSPFDATTAEAVNCCGAFDESTEGDRTPVKRTGLVWKWPFDTQKQDYKVWDGTLGAAVTAKYVKESSVKGLKTYEFRLTVPRTKVGTTQVPASVVGETGTGNVEADNMYSTTNTYQIEPYTGAIVTQSLASNNTLAVDGEDKVTTTKADIQYTPATVDSNVSDFKSKASLLKLVHTSGPIASRSCSGSSCWCWASCWPAATRRPRRRATSRYAVSSGRVARSSRLIPRSRCTGSQDSRRDDGPQAPVQDAVDLGSSRSRWCSSPCGVRAIGRSSTFQPMVSSTTKPACSTSATNPSRS